MIHTQHEAQGCEVQTNEKLKTDSFQFLQDWKGLQRFMIMENELNIAAILKDKPNVRLYDLLHNIEVELDNISTTNGVTTIWCKRELPNKVQHFGYSERGTERGWLDGLQILKPSKQMRDWSKLTWKKGDVLKRNTKKGNTCLFIRFTSDDYTTFEGIYGESQVGSYCNTNEWQIVKNEQKIKDIVYRIEKQYHGKLNLETLEIEKLPQFKDGDIVTEYSNSPFVTVFIFKKFGEYGEKTLSFYSYLQEGSFRTTTGWIDIRKNFKFRLATDSEKQQLFSALEKDEKAWDAEKKQIVDLPKKCEFKPMDWCLMRFRGTNKDVWKLCQFGFIDGKDKNDLGYCAIGGNWFDECIPYNDQTAHLLGTTDDWEGDEG